jgi:hypothetical protein
MANKLPIIIQNYKPWSSFCLEYNAAIEIDFKNVEFEYLLTLLSSQSFYTKDLPAKIWWQQDEKKLLDLMDEILS